MCYCLQVDVSRRVTLESLPKVLILHLKRFIYSKDGSQKLTKVIDYPLELTIGKGNSTVELTEHRSCILLQCTVTGDNVATATVSRFFNHRIEVFYCESEKHFITGIICGMLIVDWHISL